MIPPNCKLENGITKLNKAAKLYKKINQKGKYIMCFNKQVNAFCFFEYDNLEAINKSENIEVLWIPEDTGLK